MPGRFHPLVPGRPTVVSLALFGAAAAALFAPRADAEFSEATTKWIDEGAAAADARNWDEAIRCFTSACRQPGPRAEFGIVYLNLGLAHAQAGHDLTAIAWLQAFLATEPDARSRPAVQDQIDRLEKRVHDRAGSLFIHAIAQARELPREALERNSLWTIADALAEAGYKARADRILDELAQAPDLPLAQYRVTCWKEFFEFQFWRGRAGVLATRIHEIRPDGFDHDATLHGYIERFCYDAEFLSARRLAELIESASLKDKWLRFLADPADATRFPGEANLYRPNPQRYMFRLPDRYLDTTVDPTARREAVVDAWCDIAHAQASERVEYDLAAVLTEGAQPGEYREPQGLAAAKGSGHGPRRHMFMSPTVPNGTARTAAYFERQLDRMYGLAASIEEEARQFVELGRSRAATGDHVGAIAAYNQALALNPTFSDWAYACRAYSEYHARHYASAIADWTNALALNPQYAQAFESRAVAKTVLSNYRGAIADYDRAIALQPENATLYYRRAVVAWRHRNDREAAVRDLDRAIELRPDYREAYRERAACHTNDPAAALADFTQLIELAPNDAAARANRAWLKRDAGDLAGACEDLSAVIDQNLPSDAIFGGLASLHDDRATCRLALGDFAGALADCERRVALDSDRTSSGRQWARLQQHMLLLRSGREDAGFAAEVATWDDDWQKKLGQFLAGEMKAGELLAAAHELGPDFEDAGLADAQYYIGLTHIVAQNPKAARTLLAKAAASDDHSLNGLGSSAGFAAAELKRLEAEP